MGMSTLANLLLIVEYRKIAQIEGNNRKTSKIVALSKLQHLKPAAWSGFLPKTSFSSVNNCSCHSGCSATMARVNNDVVRVVSKLAAVSYTHLTLPTKA